MKTAKFLFFFLAVTFLWGAPVWAKKGDYILGGGAVLGKDLNVLKGFGGGLTAKGGYYFTENISLLGKMEFYFTKDAGLNYYGIPLTALAHIDIVKGFYGEAGVGLELVIPQEGVQFRSGGTKKTRPKFGPRGELNFGYQVGVSEKIWIAPELGFAYARVGGINRMVPEGRFVIGGHFR